MNNENRFDYNKIICMIGLIIIGTLGRYILVNYSLQPFPNFEVIMVLTFLAAIFLKPTYAIIVPISSMILSDLLIGNTIYAGNHMYKIVLFTYSGFAMISLLSYFKRDKYINGLAQIKLKSIGLAAGLGIGFALLYDVWTNLGWWYLIYPHNLSSLALVFTAGIPFMVYHMLSGALTFIVIALPILTYISNKTDIQLPIKIDNKHKFGAFVITIALILLSL
jgi:hypothetical protein